MLGTTVLGAVLLLSSTALAAPVGPSTLVGRSVRVSPSAGATSNPDNFVSFNGQVWLFASKAGMGRWIWSSSAGQLIPRYSVSASADNLTAAKTKLYWTDGTTIYAGNGVSSPSKVDLPSEAYLSGGMVTVGDKLLFGACDNTYGCEPWVTDGTQNGTHPAADIFAGARGSYAYLFTRFGSNALFAAEDGIHGRELWMSNGNGATLLRNIAPGALDANPFPLGVVHDKAVFMAFDDVNGYEPWVTDGSHKNTKLLRNIAPGTNGSAEGSLDAAFFNGSLYFPADDGVHGEELWKTDGTRAGTTLVADINKGPMDSFPYGLIATSKLLYFVATDKKHGFELWATGGTAATTTLVKDITPGPADTDIQLYAAAPLGSTLLFAASTAGSGNELWSSKGTPGTTSLLKDIAAGAASSYPTFLTRAGSRVFFRANDGIHGMEPWMSDGTKQGTRLFKDVNP
jgi:ELWxxDGT repeat protein